jgi:NAD(P)-dependent dehydrogenase (short-subunit alcohol dehydrogenase family)
MGSEATSRSAFITGCATGIGRAVAESLAQAGYNLTVRGDVTMLQSQQQHYYYVWWAQQTCCDGVQVVDIDQAGMLSTVSRHTQAIRKKHP